jgi:lipoprotein signal peptidase
MVAMRESPRLRGRHFLGALLRHDVLRLATLVALAAFLADWATKSWALRSLEGLQVPFGALVLGVERNDGFAFSTAAGQVEPWMVVSVRLVALAAVLLLSRRLAMRSRRYACGAALLLGGGFGNAADLIFRNGAVVDFIGAGPFVFDWAGDLVHMHIVFNVADLAIVAGLVLVAPLIRGIALTAQQRLARWEARWLARAGALSFFSSSGRNS